MRCIFLASLFLLGCPGPGAGPVTGTGDPLAPRSSPADAGVKYEPFARAKKLFGQKCAGCHIGSRRQAPRLGPGYNSRVWIKGFLLNPNGDDYYGRTKLGKMKPVKQRGSDLDALVELIYSQSGAKDAKPDLVAIGRKLFDAGGCTDCHAIDWKTEGNSGPNLGKRGSADMLSAFIAEPGHERWYGDKNQMPRFGDKLKPADRRALASYILSWQSSSE